jgi:hypothetical protein
MNTEYLNQLLQMAREGGEIEQLQYDLQNASTTLALQDAMKRLFNVVTLLTYHILHEAISRQVSAPRQAPVEQIPAPAPVQPQQCLQPQLNMHSNFGLPGLPARPPTISQPALSTPSSNGMPGIPPSDVVNVVLTPQGTQVIPPVGAGAPVSLPVNTPVRLNHVMGQPELPPASPGVAQVVVPQGGALTPEVEAALSAR